MTLDTGASRSAIPGRYITPSQFTGKIIKIRYAEGDMHDRNEARVQIVAEGQEVTLDVIVLKDDATAILLGKDYPKTRALLAKRVDKKADPVPSLVREITRAQDKVQGL